jgi:23S rRNA pseudouridine2605 synthase
MMSPAMALERVYRVRVHGSLKPADIAALARGITVDGIHYRGARFTEDEDKGGRTNRWYSCVLREGKNREIRKVMQHLGLSVTRLIRTAQGPFKLGDLPRSAVEEVNPKLLRDMVGIAAPPRIKRGVELAAEAAAARAVAAEAPPPDVTPRRPPRARRGGDPGPRRRRGEVR